jgi:hypothetical protein
VAESIEQLSFELTGGALAEQERALSGLRARAGTLLATTSVASSFFGTRSGHTTLGLWDASAVICFALCAASAIWVLLPRRLVFGFSGVTLLADNDCRGAEGLANAYRAASVWMQAALKINQEKITGLSNCLSLGCALLIAEILLWTISLVG